MKFSVKRRKKLPFNTGDNDRGDEKKLPFDTGDRLIEVTKTIAF